MGYKYKSGFLRLRIQIDMYRIQSEPNADHVKYGCFFGYQVKVTFIHITDVVKLDSNLPHSLDLVNYMILQLITLMILEALESICLFWRLDLN